MKCLKTLIAIVGMALVTGPAAAQEYWEYDQLEGEWERHDPTAGIEYEYENGVEAEAEQYEWEPGEGYHEQEWYDPSDWFEAGSDIDYESDDWPDDDFGTAYDYDYDYDYYDDQWDYGWHFEPLESDWEYGWHYDDIADYDYFDYDYQYRAPEVDYEFGQQITGRVVGLDRIRGAYGAPESVRLRVRTEEGETRTLQLGDVAYVSRFLPRLETGDEVVVGGEQVEVDGRTVFKAREIRTADESFLVPEYEYRRRIEGRLAGLRKVRTQQGDVEAVVARVEAEDGDSMNVLLGSVEELRGKAGQFRPGARIQVDGYKREVDGQSSFVVQNVKILQRADAQQQGQQQDQQPSQQAGRQPEQRAAQAQQNQQNQPQSR